MQILCSTHTLLRRKKKAALQVCSLQGPQWSCSGGMTTGAMRSVTASNTNLAGELALRLWLGLGKGLGLGSALGLGLW